MVVAVVVQNKTKSLFFVYANFLLSVVVNRNNFSGALRTRSTLGDLSTPHQNTQLYARVLHAFLSVHLNNQSILTSDINKIKNCFF